jgi:hypothetical protein
MFTEIPARPQAALSCLHLADPLDDIWQYFAYILLNTDEFLPYLANILLQKWVASVFQAACFASTDSMFY